MGKRGSIRLGEYPNSQKQTYMSSSSSNPNPSSLKHSSRLNHDLLGVQIAALFRQRTKEQRKGAVRMNAWDEGTSSHGTRTLGL
ncbi:hypothetical protein M8C21_007435 [Ambrosia artemisiifolia]|uniref:Uncharacterized protein n=1 Tax=Ambrosia artemisiifolia TaxID=4212 RepID=A0AAD5D882_AMBAR|nr:hypothetical protein M8C21_007435 [Ambrosia artemisiifolia]